MADSARRPVCVVIGVGPGLGAALARRFAAEYAVALVARGEDKLSALAKEIEKGGGKALAVSADVAKAAGIAAAFDKIRRELGEVDALLYNAAMRPFGKLMDTKPSTFENTWRVTTFGAFLAAQEVVPAMLKRGSGVDHLHRRDRGRKTLPDFSRLRAGEIRDARAGAGDGARPAAAGHSRCVRQRRRRHRHAGIRERFPQLTADDMLKPSAIAETYWHLAHQHRSAWSHDVDVRPFKEKW